MTNAQTAAEVASRLVALTNCKEPAEIIQVYDKFFNHIIEGLGEDVVVRASNPNNAVESPRNIPVVKSQEELKMKLNDYSFGTGGGVTTAMVQSSRPIKKDRPKAHPPKPKGPTTF
jgi:hypothetical protein